MNIGPTHIPDLMPLGIPATSILSSPVVVDQVLVRQLLDQMEVGHTTDTEGDIVAPFESFRLCCMIRGERGQRTFAVRTFYDRRYPTCDREHLLATLNEWNRRSLWPKAYAHTHTDGLLSVITETQMATSPGVHLDHFAASLLSWTRAAIEFHNWITDEIPEA